MSASNNFITESEMYEALHIRIAHPEIWAECCKARGYLKPASVADILKAGGVEFPENTAVLLEYFGAPEKEYEAPRSQWPLIMSVFENARLFYNEVKGDVNWKRYMIVNGNRCITVCLGHLVISIYTKKRKFGRKSKNPWIGYKEIFPILLEEIESIEYSYRIVFLRK